MYQVIFQVYTSVERGWLDYCREPSPRLGPGLNPTNIWAKDWCTKLEKREGKPFRFVLEIWN